MRFLLFLALLVLAFAAWMWSALGPTSPPLQQRGSVPTTAPMPAEASPTQGAAPAPRTEIAAPRSSIAGTLVDRERRPVAGGTVSLVVDAAVVTPGAPTDARGRFTLFDAPAGPATIRAAAAGFATIQLGDLFPGKAEGGHLEVGELTLPPAMLWQGTVRSRGRGLGGATVSMLPDLGPQGTPHPLVLRTTTDADGAFLFASGLVPPFALLVEADGHRGSSRSVASIGTPLEFDLQPLPRVTGRVLTPTGQPLPTALVWLLAAPDEPTADKLRPHQDPHPQLAHAVDAHGAFDLAVPRGRTFVVQAQADDHVPAVVGPFGTNEAVGPLVATLQPGCTVRAKVTWRGDAIAATAWLWEPGTNAQPLRQAAANGSGELAMPPVPPGRYRLVVAAEQGAFHEQELELELGPAAVRAIALPEGARLTGAVHGPRPDAAVVVCAHTSGLRRRGLVRSDGSFVVEGLGPGPWRAFVESNPQDFRSQISTMLSSLLDEPWITVGAVGEVVRNVESPALRLGRVHGRLAPEFANARIELVPNDDRQRQVAVGLRQAAVGDDGAFEIEPVLPGTWLVRLHRGGTTPPLERTLEVSRGAATVCTFP